MPSRLITTLELGLASRSRICWVAGRGLGVADRDDILQLLVVTFRVNDAELEFLLGEALHHGCCQGRLAHPRRARREDASGRRLPRHRRPFGLAADLDAVALGCEQAGVPF